MTHREKALTYLGNDQAFYVMTFVHIVDTNIKFCFKNVQIKTPNFGYAAERDCLKFEKKSWYPDIMSDDDIHWVPSADDPYNCIGHQSLYEVRRIFACCVIQETLN